MNYFTTTEFESLLIPGVKFTLRKMSHKRRMEYNHKGAEIFAKLNEIERESEPIQEEIDRAEAEAKIRPCECTHGDKDVRKYDPPAEGEEMSRVFSYVDCHDPKSLRCLSPGCDCRRPDADEAYRKRAELNQKHIEIYTDELVPLRIRWGVSAIEGLFINGEPATVESFVQEMPDEPLAEVATEIDRVMKLSLKEQIAFRSPTTGVAAGVGEPLEATLQSPIPNTTAVIVEHNICSQASVAA